MVTYSDVVQDDYQRPIPGVQVYVYNQDGSLALLAATGNPVTTNIYGQYTISVPDPGAVVNLEYRFAGVTKRLDSVIIGKPAQYVGDTGPTGPANSTYTSASAIRTTAPVANTSAILAANGRRDIYVWVPDGVGAGTADYDYITSDLAVGVWKRFDGPLYAGNFGVVGNASSDNSGNVAGVDDTVAVQAFQNLCAGLNRIAYYGSLRPLLSGPITIHNGSCVFDRQSFTATGEAPGVNRGEPGFYVTGSGYTAVTVSGICTQFCATVCGGGDATTDSSGAITADTRPDIVGIQFGNPLGSGPGTLILSNIQWARVTKMRNTGIRVVNAFDVRFGALLTEACGGTDGYAISIEDGGNTTNESVFEYIQAEFSKQRAIYISPNTLSCVFLKIHSERTTSISGVNAWQFGPGNYSAVRVSSTNILGYALISAQNGEMRSLRPEFVRVMVNSTGGSFTLIEGAFAQGIEPAAGSNGAVNIIGGTGYFWLTQNWYCRGAMMDEANINGCPDGYWAVLDHCRVAALRRTDDSASVEVSGGRVDALRAGQWREIRITNNSRVALEGGSQTFAQMKLALDATSKIVGNVTMDSAGGRIAGRVEGDYNMTGLRGTLFADTAEITGAMNTSAPPESESYLDGAADGVRTKNCRPSLEQSNGFSFTVAGWIREGGQYREELAMRRPLPTGTTA